MEYTLFQDFARKIPRLAPPTGRPGPTQSGRTPEFGYRPLVLDHFWVCPGCLAYCYKYKHTLYPYTTINMAPKLNKNLPLSLGPAPTHKDHLTFEPS